ncbi:MAG TPA: hypothetical protein VGI19_15915, partial [Candidatus Cybelea sp.]
MAEKQRRYRERISVCSVGRQCVVKLAPWLKHHDDASRHLGAPNDLYDYTRPRAFRSGRPQHWRTGQ